MGGRRSQIAAAAALAAITGMAFAVPTLPAASNEPNNSRLEAVGPLLAGQGLTAALETAEDRDFYFFYAVADEPATDISLHNAGGGPAGSDIDLVVLDSVGTQVAGQYFILQGETRTLKAQLAPGKYYVELKASQGLGDSYTLTGVSGPLASYGQIAARCQARRAALAGAERRLRKAQGRLQRATARRRRSRYLPPKGRLRARRAQARARAQLRTASRDRREAAAALSPWCAIPQ